jgi:hypothetical protein
MTVDVMPGSSVELGRPRGHQGEGLMRAKCYLSVFAWLALAAVFALATAPLMAATPETYYYFVFSNPVAGQDAQYNKWYNEQHQVDVVAVPGFVSAQRFVMNDLPLYRMAELQLPKYLVVYKIVTNDLEAVFKEVSRRLQTNETKMDPSFDRVTSVGYVYRALGPWVKGVGGEAAGAKPGKKELYYHIVFTPFVEGKEDMFNEIYTKHHAPELASIPGFTGAQRMIIARPDTAKIKGTKYLALFTVETSDLAAVKEGTNVRGTPNPGQDGAGTRGYTFRAFAPQVLGDKVRAERTKVAKH